MLKSNLLSVDRPPLHVAIIMDGNGRWAQARGLPRVAGHRAGASAVRRTVEAAAGLGVRILTLYAFSADNWQRPAAEVETLFRLLGEYLRHELDRCLEHGIRVSVIGRRDRLPAGLVEAIAETERATAAGRKLHLRIAVDYSARDAILGAALAVNGAGRLSREDFARLLGRAVNAGEPVGEVDLLIRTGGEQRLSDFLLWECAYAELHFTARMWPDFDAPDLEAALRDFRSRQRRFGRLPDAAAG